MQDFLIIGSALIDVIAKLRAAERKTVSGTALLCLPFGSKAAVETMSLSCGGAALNVAVTLDCMGSSCALLTCIGKDPLGRHLLEKLKETHISRAYLRETDKQTGIGINLIYKGEKSALASHGAVDSLNKSDITEAMVRSSRQILITSLTSESNLALLQKTFHLAKKCKTPIIFAPGMTMVEALKKTRKELPAVDLCILNYDEARHLTQERDIKRILRALPARVAVVTKDVEGAYARIRLPPKGNEMRRPLRSRKATSNTLHRAKEEILHINSLPVAIASTTGAGDAFCGAFVHMYYNQESSLPEALRVATTVAAMKLSQMEAEVQCFPPQVMRLLHTYEKQLRIEQL